MAEGFLRVSADAPPEHPPPAAEAAAAAVAPSRDTGLASGPPDPTGTTAVTPLLAPPLMAPPPLSNSVGGAEGTQVCVELGPTAVEFRRGAQIRLQVRPARRACMRPVLIPASQAPRE